MNQDSNQAMKFFILLLVHMFKKLLLVSKLCPGGYDS